MELPSGFNKQKKPELFEKLSEESLQDLLGHSIMQEFEAGRLLVQQGDVPEYVYLVIEGAVKTSRMSEEGGEATIRMLQPGETCMEAVMFMGGPSPINVYVMEDAKVLMIPGKIIRAHALEDSQFAVNLLRIVTRHYKNAMHQIDAMNIKSPLQRVGYYFLLKYIEQGPENLEFKLPFRKQVIANYLGMTPETFSWASMSMTTRSGCGILLYYAIFVILTRTPYVNGQTKKIAENARCIKTRRTEEGTYLQHPRFLIFPNPLVHEPTHSYPKTG